MNPMRCLAMLVFFACTGCAARPAPGGAAAEPAAPLSGARAARCFRVSAIDSWRVIDDRQLVVYGPRRDQAWLLKLFSPCDGLRFTEVLGFRASGMDLVCGDPGDDIVWQGRRCPISSVRALAPAEARALTDSKVRDDIGRMPGPAPGHDQDQEDPR